MLEPEESEMADRQTAIKANPAPSDCRHFENGCAGFHLAESSVDKSGGGVN